VADARLGSLVMAGHGGQPRDLAALVVPAAGGLLEAGSGWERYQLAGPDGTAVEPVSAWFRDLRAAGRSQATVRSYGMDLLRWFRFLWAIGLPWERATRRRLVASACGC
jgi:hypothetical protein